MSLVCLYTDQVWVDVYISTHLHALAPAMSRPSDFKVYTLHENEGVFISINKETWTQPGTDNYAIVSLGPFDRRSLKSELLKGEIIIHVVDGVADDDRVGSLDRYMTKPDYKTIEQYKQFIFDFTLRAIMDAVLAKQLVEQVRTCAELVNVVDVPPAKQIKMNRHALVQLIEQQLGFSVMKRAKTYRADDEHGNEQSTKIKRWAHENGLTETTDKDIVADIGFQSGTPSDLRSPNFVHMIMPVPSANIPTASQFYTHTYDRAGTSDMRNKKDERLKLDALIQRFDMPDFTVA